MENIDSSNGLLEEILKGSNRSIVWYSHFNSKSQENHEGFSMEPIALLRPLDFILLPDTPKIISAWKWAQSEFNYTDNQVIWYNYFKDGDEQEFIYNLLKQFEGKNIILVGYVLTRVVIDISIKLGIPYYGDCTFETPDKRWIHPTIPGSIHSSNVYNFDLPNVKSPEGFTVYSKEELKIARELLIHKGISDVVIKNANGVVGFGIYYCKSDQEFEKIFQEIEFKNGQIDIFHYNTLPAYLIEQRIDLYYEYNNENIKCTPVVYFLGNKLVKVCRQLVRNDRFIGTKSRPFDEKIQANLDIEINKLLEKIPKFNVGPWGVDFLCDKLGNVYVTDPNLGRFNSGIFPCIFLSLYAPGKCFMINKIGYEDWEELFNELKKRKLSFNHQTKKGITYLIPTDVVIFSTALIIGDNEDEVESLYEEFSKVKIDLLNKK